MTAPPAGATLADWLDYQERLHPKVIELGLERVRSVATRLGLPDAAIATLIVGGTNGKGSSASLAALIYREAGYRVGLYTSPHLLRYNERVAIDGADASDEDLCTAFAAVEAARGEVALTYFEFGTLAALWLFREQDCEVQVLEVGLGGRLDAVNIVDADGALLTNVGLDHTDWLGPDRDSIAAEKAPIFRAGRPAIHADPDPCATVARYAAKVDARYWQVGRDYAFAADPTRGTWTWRGPGRVMLRLPAPGLRGDAQLRNAAGVLALVHALRGRLPVDEGHIRSALPELALRGRFERVGNTVFDVAHNAEAAQVLAANLARERPGRRLQLVLAMLADKPAAEFARRLAPHVAQAHLASLPGVRGQGAAELAQKIGSILPIAGLHDSPAAALAAARADAAPKAWVVVTGSFLTVAASLADG